MFTNSIISAIMAFSALAAATPYPTYNLNTRQDPGCTGNQTFWEGSWRCLTRPSDCTAVYEVQSGDTCISIGRKFANFTLSIFRYWNPEISQECGETFSIVPVCINTEWYTFTPPVQSPDGTIVNTDEINETELPVPIMSHIVPECNRFFLTASGQRVDAIAPLAGVTIEQMLEWNPSIDPEFPTAWAGYWVCVGVGEGVNAKLARGQLI